MRYLYLFCLLLCGGAPAVATHIVSSDITFGREAGAGDFTYRITVNLYLDEDASVDPANEPVVIIFGADEATEVLAEWVRTDSLSPLSYRATYQVLHAFPAAGSYRVSASFSDRQSVSNAAPGVSTYFIDTQVLVSAALAVEGGPVFLRHALQHAYVGEPFTTNMTAYSPEDYALRYELIPPRDDPDTPLPGYVLPVGVSLDTLSGAFRWESPAQPGTYAFAVRISQQTNGLTVGYATRDFLVTVADAPHDQALALTEATFATVAEGNRVTYTDGGNLRLRVRLTDPNADAPFWEAHSELLLPGVSNATFTTETTPEGLFGVFTLTPTEALVRTNPYIITFRGNSGPIAPFGRRTNDLTVVLYLLGPATSLPAATPVGTVYPNPVADHLTVEGSTATTLRLYDGAGRLVYTRPLAAGTVRIRRPALPAGLYFYQLGEGPSARTGRLSFN